MLDLETTDDDALAVVGLAGEGEGEVTILVGNLRPRATEFKLEGHNLPFRYAVLDVAATERTLGGDTSVPDQGRPLSGSVQLQPHEIAVVTAP